MLKKSTRFHYWNWMDFNVASLELCASSWVKNKNKHSVRENQQREREGGGGVGKSKETMMERWNMGAGCLAGLTQWAIGSCVLYTHREGIEVRQAKNKDSRTDVNHVGVSNALSQLSFSTVSKRLNCVRMLKKRARRRFCCADFSFSLSLTSFQSVKCSPHGVTDTL
jgi:hypothetical protein